MSVVPRRYLSLKTVSLKDSRDRGVRLFRYLRIGLGDEQPAVRHKWFERI